MVLDCHSSGRNIDALGYLISKVVTALDIIDVNKLNMGIRICCLNELFLAALWLIQHAIFISLLNYRIQFFKTSFWCFLNSILLSFFLHFCAVLIRIRVYI